MTAPQWGHVAQHALAPYHVRNAARQAYGMVPSSPPAMGQLINLSELSSPGAALYRHALSQDRSATVATGDYVVGGVTVGAAALVALIAIAVAINYQIGKAMAPNEQTEGRWAWGNAIGGTIFPPFTLGMAIYKNYFRD
jgi:hypothetical protein